MEAAQSDALVFFGASGDLAFKQIFPAFWALSAVKARKCPIVGVAKAGWTVEQLRDEPRTVSKSTGALTLQAR